MANPLSTCFIVLYTNRSIAIRSSITLKLNTVPATRDTEHTTIIMLMLLIKLPYNC